MRVPVATIKYNLNETKQRRRIVDNNTICC